MNEVEEIQPYSKSAITGFVLCVISIPFFFVGIIPVIAIVFSSIGLNATGKKHKMRGRLMAWLGLVIGIVYAIKSGLLYFGYIEW